MQKWKTRSRQMRLPKVNLSEPTKRTGLSGQPSGRPWRQNRQEAPLVHAARAFKHPLEILDKKSTESPAADGREARHLDDLMNTIHSKGDPVRDTPDIDYSVGKKRRASRFPKTEVRRSEAESSSRLAQVSVQIRSLVPAGPSKAVAQRALKVDGDKYDKSNLGDLKEIFQLELPPWRHIWSRKVGAMIKARKIFNFGDLEELKDYLDKEVGYKERGYIELIPPNRSGNAKAKRKGLVAALDKKTGDILGYYLSQDEDGDEHGILVPTSRINIQRMERDLKASPKYSLEGRDQYGHGYAFATSEEGVDQVEVDDIQDWDFLDNVLQIEKGESFRAKRNFKLPLSCSTAAEFVIQNQAKGSIPNYKNYKGETNVHILDKSGSLVKSSGKTVDLGSDSLKKNVMSNPGFEAPKGDQIEELGRSTAETSGAGRGAIAWRRGGKAYDHHAVSVVAANKGTGEIICIERNAGHTSGKSTDTNKEWLLNLYQGYAGFAREAGKEIGQVLYSQKAEIERLTGILGKVGGPLKPEEKAKAFRLLKRLFDVGNNDPDLANEKIRAISDLNLSLLGRQLEAAVKKRLEALKEELREAQESSSGSEVSSSGSEREGHHGSSKQEISEDWFLKQFKEKVKNKALKAPYSKEAKALATSYYDDMKGRASMPEIAADLGVGLVTLRSWINKRA